MEKSAKSREEDGPIENVSRPGTKALKEEPQKKKKLVFFELDNRNNAQNNSQYDVANIKIKELLCTTSKGRNGGRGNGTETGSGDGLNVASSGGRDALAGPRTCQFPAGATGDVSRMIFDEFGIDLIELQNRIVELEKQLKNDNLELPAILSDLKSQVENFRNKLETAEWHRRTELQKEPFCQRFQYRRTSSERGRKIRDKFINICEKEISKSTIEWLKQPSFDSSQYEDEEILLFIQHMFLELGLIEKFDIRLPVLRNFLYEVYKNYNEVPFHNFRHCFCVAQMMYVMIWSVDIPNRMGDLDTLILLTACICHDLDHPGYNNIYQINARTELALLYNDISPLENHHCSVAFRILENPDCNIFAALDKETFKEIREGIIRCILATDMARHNEILTQFKDVISDFDFANKGHKNLLSMILIKVADISNEARPMNVAEPWLDRLLTEFFKQSDAEKQEGLPVTPFMDRDKITKPSSQCSFIGFVLLPLFEALGELLPELHDLIITPAKDALEHYRRLNEAAKDERMRRKSIADTGNLENSEDFENSTMVKSGSGHSVRSRRSFCNSCAQVRQRSRSSEDFEPDVSPPLSPSAFSIVADDLENVDEREELIVEDDVDEDELEEETVTEVEVSEKTLKFKISTEGSTSTNFPSGRKSCPGNFPGSRKGSRERNQYLEYDSEWTRMMMRDRDERSLKRSMTSDTMSSGKGSSDSENRMEKTSRKGSGSSEGRNEDPKKWSPRQKDGQRKMINHYGKTGHEYRRKSVAVERPRTGRTEHAVRRSSLATSTRTPVTTVTVAAEKKIRQPETVDSVLEKLSRSHDCDEDRGSREFETSCWGLQNLKMGGAHLNASLNVSNNGPFDNTTARKSITSEKSKSEDNLSIAAGVTSSVAENRKSGSDVILMNNLNVYKGGDAGEKVSDRKQGHPSILSRLKHLRDKIAFGREAETGVDVASEIGNNGCHTTMATTTTTTTTEPNVGDNKRSDNECGDQDYERSRTLPKARKPGRTSGAKMRRGWRALIGKSEGNSSSSSLDFPSPGSPSPIRRRKSSVEDVATRKSSAGSGGITSGTDKKKSMWLPSPKKSGFLGRISGRYECDGTDGTFSGRNNFLNNLTSSFRKKGTRNEDENGAGFSGSGRRDGSKPN